MRSELPAVHLERSAIYWQKIYKYSQIGSDRSDENSAALIAVTGPGRTVSW